MVTKDDIEGFLNRLGSDGASYSEVMQLPTDAESLATLSRRLLELNATDLVHGAYGIEDESIVMTEALELSHLDYEEFLAAYESITVALASHLRELGSFREAH
jgi:hypothetical protein